MRSSSRLPILWALVLVAAVLTVITVSRSGHSWPSTAGIWVLKGATNDTHLDVAPHPFDGDKRGWIGNPFDALGLNVAHLPVRDVHIGIIRPGATRGNHRHHSKHELIIVFGAQMDLRVGDAHYHSSAEEVLALRCPPGTPHLIHNVDPDGKIVSLMAFVDSQWDPANPATDYKVWQPAALEPFSAE